MASKGNQIQPITVLEFKLGCIIYMIKVPPHESHSKLFASATGNATNTRNYERFIFMKFTIGPSMNRNSFPLSPSPRILISFVVTKHIAPRIISYIVVCIFIKLLPSHVFINKGRGFPFPLPGTRS